MHSRRTLSGTLGPPCLARVTSFLGYRASSDNLIRWQCAEPLVLPTRRVLGVDEFAFRGGSTEATLLVNLERQQLIAVLEGRTAEPLMQWLQVHPSVTTLVRNRANAHVLAR